MARCIISILVTLFLLSISQTSSACDRLRYRASVEKIVGDADVVFIGIVDKTDIEEQSLFIQGEFNNHIEVFKAYKGWLPNYVKVSGYSNDCISNHWPFKVGKMLLIVADYDSTGGLKLPHFYGDLNRNELLLYLEKGAGRHQSSECLAQALKITNKPDAHGKVQPLPDLSLCFKKDEHDKNPFRYIPPKPKAKATVSGK